MNDKAIVVSVQWAELIGRLEERKRSLNTASGSSRQYYSNLGILQDALHKIGDSLEDVASEKMPPEKLLQKLEDLHEHLESQSHLLTEVETVSGQLCAVLNDASSQEEVTHKFSHMEKMYWQLKKKLDFRRTELENTLKDTREFESQHEHLQTWLKDCGKYTVEALRVSADGERLRQQLQENEPIYQKIMDKEQEISMILDRGQELAYQSRDAHSMRKMLEKTRSDWNKLRQEAANRHRRLQTSMELCRKFGDARDTILLKLDQAEEKLNVMRPVSFKKIELEQQIKELQIFRNNTSRQGVAAEMSKSMGDSFLSSCDVDKEAVEAEVSIVNQRWEALNGSLLERALSLEDISKLLAEFTQHLRDAQHAAERCEDHLTSLDAPVLAAHVSKLPDRIRQMLDEVALLEKEVQRVQTCATKLLAEASTHGSDASHIQEETDRLVNHYKYLRAQLEGRCHSLETASQAASQLIERVKVIGNNLAVLENELEGMSPSGRDLKVLNVQLDQAKHLLSKLRVYQSEIKAVTIDGNPDAGSTSEQLDNLRKWVSRLEERGKYRLDELEKTVQQIENFYDLFENAMHHINEVNMGEMTNKSIGADIELINNQEEFHNFKQEMFLPLSHTLDEVNRIGQGLIKSASNGVSTSVLEADLENMNECWNTLKEKLDNQERCFDVAFLRFGQFNEALQGLSKWLSDTEEMVINQRSPSADYKVIKAQIQEQKFLEKLLLDREVSISSLLEMGHDVASRDDADNQAEIQDQLQQLVLRFNALTTAADDRMNLLQKAATVSKEFQDQVNPIADWLKKTERKIKEMETIPTDEEHIQQQIEEHDATHNDIISKKAAFDSLADVATVLTALVSDDEAAALTDRLSELTDHYGILVESSESVGLLLKQTKKGLRHLVLTYEDLSIWMDDMEMKLATFRTLSVHVEKLQEQMENVMHLTEEIAAYQPSVESVVSTGLVLMRHITNEEALELKEKLDSVQRGYADLAGKADDLLKHAQETLPLVEQFHMSHGRLSDWLFDAEMNVQALESSIAMVSSGLGFQGSTIDRLENELGEFRSVLDIVNQIGPQLQQRRTEDARFIETLVARDNRRFNVVCEQIQRKAERLHLSRLRSMEVIGDLDDLLDWFRETESHLREAEPPSSDP